MTDGLWLIHRLFIKYSGDNKKAIMALKHKTNFKITSGWLTRSTMENPHFKHVYAFVSLITVFVAVFFLSYYINGKYNPVSPTSANVNNGYFVSLTPSGVAPMRIDTTPDARLATTAQTLNINTNAPSGARVFLSTTTDNNNLNHTSGNGAYISTTDTPIDNPGNLPSNTWGFTNNTDFNNQQRYSAIPPKSHPVQIYQGGSNNIPLYYALKANDAVPNGTYANTIYYTAIIEASDNPDGEASLSPDNQPDLNAGRRIRITTSFKADTNMDANEIHINNIQLGSGACTSPAIVSTSPLTIDCTVPANNEGSYNATVNITHLILGNKTYTTSNQYRYIDPIGFAGIKNMQDMTYAVCDRATADQTGTLRDTRDGQVYSVFKGRDGNCWMNSDLNLQLSTTKTLTPADSNVSRNWVPQFDTQAPGQTGTIWAYHQEGDDQAHSVNMTNPDPKHGTLYNWYAATAGTGTAAMNIDGQEATDSICPKGWRLPNGRNKPKSFQRLADAYGITDSEAGSTILRNPPLSFIISGGYVGYHSSGQPYNQSSAGYYWSSTVYSGNRARILIFYPHSVSFDAQSAEAWDFKAFGLSVRCVSL